MINRFDPFASDAPLIVYLDIKSPYAFIARDPTRAMAARLGIDVDWRPLTLDIPSFLGSARLDDKGKVAEQNRTPDQWRGVRYAYRDARRYARIAGYMLRGTVKIWDTSLVHMAMEWAKRQGVDAMDRYLDVAYPRFWRRELDAEDRPSLFQYPMGTDTQSRDLYAVNLRGIPLTLGTGLIAGLLSVGLGTVTAFLAAYYRGIPDLLIRLMTDVGISIPGLLVLIIIRIQLGTELTWWQLGAGLAAVGWVFSSRTVRAQVLVLREQPYVEIARQSGMSGLGIIFREMMPNLIPYITASFVGSVAGAILASIGLEALGLGDFSSPSLGMTVYWVIQFGAITQNMWWWWLFPLIFIVVIFVSLFLISPGLDEWSNPRLRRQV